MKRAGGAAARRAVACTAAYPGKLAAMLFQRWLLMAMLILLGVAAVLGVVSVFLPGGALLPRVAIMLVAAAVAAGAARGAARSLEREESRPVGLAGLVAVAVAFVLALMGIWGPLLMGPRFDAEMAFTALLFIPFGLAAVASFQASRSPHGRVCGRVALGTFVAGFVSSMAGVWSAGLPVGDPARLASTTLLILACGLAASASVYNHDRNPGRWLRVGALFAAGALAVGLVAIWTAPGQRGPTEWMAHLLIVAGTLGLINAVLNIPVPPTGRWIALGTATATVATATCTVLLNIETLGFGDARPPEGLVRAVAALAVVTGSGVLAVALVSMFNRRPLLTRTVAIASLAGLDATCPRCARRFTARVGQSACPGCRMLVVLQLAEPRCPRCDYTWLDLAADHCPECGEPVG